MTSHLEWDRSAMVMANAEFICIKSESGRGAMRLGSSETCVVLDGDADDPALGRAILSELARSRHLTPMQLLEAVISVERLYKSWVARMMERFQYRNRRAMFKSMKACMVLSRTGGFVLRPLHQDKLEGWSRTEDDGIQDIDLAKPATPAELGAAVRQAFARCA
ncbi:MAG: contact-dependent growth inhibition system immunity protein [Microvirga sp.]